jgi:hypothetical protein
METAVQAFGGGYEAMKGVTEDIASSEILKQAYAGQTPEEIKDPIRQAATLQSAAGMLQAKGLNSAAYKLQKQAGDLSTDVSKQQIDQLKVKEAKLGYAGQLVQSASTPSDLITAISAAGVDEPTQLQLADAVRRFGDTPEGFQKAKAMLINVSQTADQQLKAQQLTLTTASTLSKLQDRETDNIRLEREFALKQAGMYTAAQQPIPEAIAKRAGLIPSEGEAPSTFLAGRGAAEAPSYDTVAAGGALGKYGMKPKTLDLLRKIDPSLPKTNEEYLKDPKAQDKAASLLEKENEKEIKASGNKVTQVNKDLFYRFGAPDATKIINAYDKNPNTKIDSIVSEQVIKENPDLAGKTVAQAIAGNVSVDKQPSSGLSLDKATKGAFQERMRGEQIIGAFKELKRSTGIIAELPLTVSGGTFGSRKQSTGFFNAPLNAVANKLTSEQERMYNMASSNVGQTLAIIEAGGLKPAQSQITNYQDKLRWQPTDTPYTKLFSMADAKAQAFERADVILASPAVPKEQKDLLRKAMDDFNAIIPFEPEDIAKAREKGQSINDYIKEKKEKGLKPTAASKGPAAGTIMDGYRFKGGNAGDKANWEKV